MIPVVDNAHISEAQARLLSVFKKPKILALTGAMADSAQKLEDVIWQVINLRNIDDGFGNQLDVIGRLVGEPRNGKTDTQYKPFLRIRIAADKCQGTIPEVLNIVNMVSLADSGAAWWYYSAFPAGWSVTYAGSYPDAYALASLATELTPGGVRASVRWPALDITRTMRAGSVRAAVDRATAAGSIHGGANSTYPAFLVPTTGL